MVQITPKQHGTAFGNRVCDRVHARYLHGLDRADWAGVEVSALLYNTVIPITWN